MIFEIFALLLILTASFILFGRVHHSPPLEVIGYTFLFLLGVTLMLGGVTYAAGETITVTNVTLYNGTVAGADTQTDTIYTNYSGEIVAGIQLHHFFGFFVAIGGVFGFITFFLNFKEADTYGQ